MISDSKCDQKPVMYYLIKFGMQLILFITCADGGNTLRCLHLSMLPSRELYTLW